MVETLYAFVENDDTQTAKGYMLTSGSKKVVLFWVSRSSPRVSPEKIRQWSDNGDIPPIDPQLQEVSYSSLLTEEMRRQ